MILKNDKSFGISDKDYDFFIKNYEKIKPIKYIHVYFKSANFLLTKYNVENGTTFVAEGWNGNEIHLTGINCGYGGTGPSRMADILNYIGISKENAFHLKHYSSLYFEFDEKGKLIKETHSNSPFFGHTNDSPVMLDDFTYIEFENKRLYFINPQLHNMKGVYSAIQKFKPDEFQYYIGPDSPLNNHYRPDRGSLSYIFSREHITGINLILRSSQFDLLFLIDKSISRSFVNMIHYFIFRESLFNDDKYKNLPRFLNFIYKVFNKEDDTCYGVKEIDR